MEKKERAEEKSFHIGVILSIIYIKLLQPLGGHGVRAFLDFMTGDQVFMGQIARVSDECRPYLIKQFPQFATAEFEKEVAELLETLKKEKSSKRKGVAKKWLIEQVKKYGEFHKVNSLPPGAHKICQPCSGCGGDIDKDHPVFIDSTIGNAFHCKSCEMLQREDGTPIAENQHDLREKIARKME